MKSRLFFLAGVVMIALAGALATYAFLSPNGYSRKVDFPGQQNLCESRTYCDTQGFLPCTFQDVRLFDLTCTIQLNRLP